MPVTAACFIIGGVAISALPPLNGFASEFMIYSGLFSGAPMNIWATLMLSLVATALAFVGAVSALSITRAFGVIFMGHSRDDTLPEAHEASRWMLLPMLAHTLGTVLLGIVPVLGLALVAAPVRRFMQGTPEALADQTLSEIFGTLSRIGAISGALVAAIVAVLWLRSRFWPQAAQRSATWGCGYDAANSRMQYSGASFSTDFAARFKSVMVMVKRQKAPAGYFPSESYVITDCVDAVERRLYTMIDHGQETAVELSAKMREDDPRLAFSVALAAIVIIASLVVLAEGALP
jgi:hydrogenase-4 component B